MKLILVHSLILGLLLSIVSLLGYYSQTNNYVNDSVQWFLGFIGLGGIMIFAINNHLIAQKKYDYAVGFGICILVAIFGKIIYLLTLTTIVFFRKNSLPDFYVILNIFMEGMFLAFLFSIIIPISFISKKEE